MLLSFNEVLEEELKLRVPKVYVLFGNRLHGCDFATLMHKNAIPLVVTAS